MGLRWTGNKLILRVDSIDYTLPTNPGLQVVSTEAEARAASGWAMRLLDAGSYPLKDQAWYYNGTYYGYSQGRN